LMVAKRRAHRPSRHRPCPGPARPARRRPGHRRAAADRGGRPSRAAAFGGGLGPPVRRCPDPGIVGEGHPSPAQSRRQPRGQSCPVADRDHPDERACPDPGLCRAAQ
jgi:hypothetical protein